MKVKQIISHLFKLKSPSQNGIWVKRVSPKSSGNLILPQRIYNSQNSNWASAMFTSQNYPMLRGKHCQNPIAVMEIHQGITVSLKHDPTKIAIAMTKNNLFHVTGKVLKAVIHIRCKHFNRSTEFDENLSQRCYRVSHGKVNKVIWLS